LAVGGPVSRHQPDLELAHVNEHKGGIEVAAHLLEFDTVHGRFPGTIAVAGDHLVIDGAMVTFSERSDPTDIAWVDQGVDLAIEATGAFTTAETIVPHFDRGAVKVIVACPVKSDGVLNVVMGCNDHLYDPVVHRIVTAASCTTNCLAPVVKVLHEGIGIERGAVSTIHDVTNTQVVVDAPHKDLRRARSALNSLIPTSTGSATTITPHLAGADREAQRDRGAGPIAQRVAHRLRVRAEPADHG
jgi:glyceraldehyde 3-phosphate dehydrogenase